eukprot:PITA_34363
MYIATADTTIGIVLVQEEDGIEHLIYYLSCNLNGTEVKYSYVKNLALATVQAVQRFHHYILLRKTIVISDCNPMTYILSRQFLGGKYSKWIGILQDFDLEFIKFKSKKSLVFSELLCDLPSNTIDSTSEPSILDESLFLISSSNACIDMILQRCLTHEEVEKVLNDFHSSACHVHLSGYATIFKIPHSCQIYDRKARLPPTPLHPIVVVGPFTKWGIDFMTCNPTLNGGHGYIIVIVDYFKKWSQAMPTLNNSGETATLFFFNHVVTRFGVP